MNTKFQDLYMQDNNGATRHWRIKAEGDKIIWEHGILGGAMQTREEIVPHGKAGRSLDEQIMSQMASKIKSQRMKGYNSDLTSAERRPVNLLNLEKPMLAQPLKGVKNLDLVGAYVQPKFDGNRCIITRRDDKMIAYSRNGKTIAANLDHIFIGLDLDNGESIDGELYSHGESLQTIVSWVKRDQDNTRKLNFHAYDIISEHTYADRYTRLLNICNGPSIKLAQTDKVNNIGEVWELHKQHTDDGYEGAIIRVGDSGYEAGKRSRSLIKVKTFLDDIFYVVDILPSKDGWARIVCKTEYGTEFKVSAPGTIIEKEYILEHAHEFLDKAIRVEYMNWTADKKPFHPIATNFLD